MVSQGPQGAGSLSLAEGETLSPAGKKNRDFQNVFFAKLGLLTHFSSYGKGQTAKI